MITIEEAKRQLEDLKEQPKFHKMLHTSAILTSLFKNENLRPIIVGGLAVEIYTRNEYTTLDIDLIFSQRDIADFYLTRIGFKREGRHWFHRELMISIEIPNDMLEDADVDKIVEIELPDGLNVFVIGIEDIILDRLRACIHWKSTSDCEWAKRLFLLHEDRLDHAYLNEQAKKDQTFGCIEAWLET